MQNRPGIAKAIDSLEGQGAKIYLAFALEQIRKLKEEEATPEKTMFQLFELYDEVIEFSEKRAAWDPDPACTHVHFVPGCSFAGGMKAALKQLGWPGTHKVITLPDNYAIGPLRELESYEGRRARRDWFQDHITEDCEVYDDSDEENDQLLDRVNKIPEQAKVIVWTGRNACERIGMLHAVRLMSGRPHCIAVYDACTICEELINSPEATSRFRYSGEIPANLLQTALVRMDGSSCLNDADKAGLEREWQALIKQSGTLRIWHDGAVAEVPDDYYDTYLLDKLDHLRTAFDSRFLKAARLVGEAMGCCDQFIGDAYFEYRLRKLIYEGILEIKGVPRSIRHYSVRRKMLSSY
ncbi:DUF1835 domain-containing protein [Paenibacillus sp. 1P03SA]|uniref:DUF1835 domain-containing protein n=1 Tax=Paenibacillus sp. 1P03SA TaxID=3132294 RepID=UPI00399FA709